MADEKRTIHLLNYEARRPTLGERLAQRLSHWPLWVIALLLILPVMVLNSYEIYHWLPRFIPYWFHSFVERTQVYLLSAAIFLPAALRRLSWRQALGMAAFAGGAYAINQLPWDTAIHYPYFLIAWTALFVGIGEWIMNPPRRPRMLIWTLVLTAAVAFVVPAINQLVARRMVDLPTGTSLRLQLDASYLLYWSLIAVLTWLAIPAAERLANGQGRAKRCLAVTALVVSAAWFMVFFQIIIFPLAARSLVHGWPLDRDFALAVIRTRHDTSYDAVLWQLVEDANYRPRTTDWGEDDERKWCIQVLAEHDRAATARRLSALLRQRPSRQLAECAAPVLAEEHCYETCPELMRYVLLDPLGSAPEQALECMRIPLIAEDILIKEAACKALSATTRPTPDWTIQPETQRRLATLLGKDVGPKWRDWMNFCDKEIDKCPTPLSADQVSEVNRVVRAINLYWSIRNRLRRTGRVLSIPDPNLDVPGTTALEQAVDKYRLAADAAAGH